MHMKNDEELAISIVQHWSGNDVTVTGLGPGDNADFEIIVRDRKKGIGEVKSDVHEPTKAQWEAILNREGSQIFDLPEGLGVWSFRIDSNAHIGMLQNVLGEITSKILSLGYEGWSREWNYPRTEFDASWAALGIIDFHKAQEVQGNYAYLQPDGVGGMVPTDSNLAAPWIESLLEKDDWQKSWARLRNSDSDERHIFFWIDSNSPKDLRLRVTFHPDEPPTEYPVLPDGITHLWVGVAVSFKSHLSAWLFRPNLGWESIRVPW